MRVEAFVVFAKFKPINEIQWSEHFVIESNVVFNSVAELYELQSPCESGWMYMFVQNCLAARVIEYR